MKVKPELNSIVESMIVEYNSATTVDERNKVLANLVKGINVIKEIEGQEIENQIKKKRVKLDEEKLKLEERRYTLEAEKLELEREKLTNDQLKSIASQAVDDRKLKLEDSKLDFDKHKFNFDVSKSKSDKVYNSVMKGLEIGLPLIIYTGLSVLSLKAIYKDDVRVPSETWNFIKNVLKK